MTNFILVPDATVVKEVGDGEEEMRFCCAVRGVDEADARRRASLAFDLSRKAIEDVQRVMRTTLDLALEEAGPGAHFLVCARVASFLLSGMVMSDRAGQNEAAGRVVRELDSPPTGEELLGQALRVAASRHPEGLAGNPDRLAERWLRLLVKKNAAGPSS